MDAFYLLLALSLGAGVLGTGIGGSLGALCASKGDRAASSVSAFAGGVMLGVSAFEMIPESVECFSTLEVWGAVCAMASLAAGAIFVGLLSRLVGRWGRRQGGGGGVQAAALALGEADVGADKRRMLRAGTLMLFAIALHNLPEGMAIGGAGMHDLATGVTVALTLALHNVPEGMAISTPLMGGGMKAWKAAGLACLAGATTVPGALIGLALGGLGGIATGVCLGISAGAMLFVTLFDMLPETVASSGRLPSAGVFFGILCAACFVYLV